ncbi:MAG TPA: outer membrane beta-barrel protein, partial [Brevundimonas sp.]
LRRADYQDNGSENFTNYQVGGTGQVDVRRDTSIGFGADYGKFTELRTSNNAPTNVAEPVEYDQTGANLQLVHSFNRLRLLGRIDRVELDYQNGVDALGGQVFQDDRDRSVTAVTGRSEYAVSPDTAVFFEAVFNTREYDLSPPDVVTDRDSDGSEISLGANFDISRLARGEVQLGYLTQDYTAADLEDFANLTGRARLEWFPSDLLTVSFVTGRTVEDATGAGISGYLSTTAGLTADYEVRRNLVLSAGATYEAADYGDIDRDDNTWTSQIEATYKVNRTLAISAGFEHLERDSSGLSATTDYRINRFQLAFVLQR